MYRIVITFLLLTLIACKTDCYDESWEVIEINGNTPFMQEIKELRFSDKGIEFIGNGKSQKFPVYVSGDKMIINIVLDKILVKLEYEGDSLLTINELYNKEVFSVKLKKIKRINAI